MHHPMYVSKRINPFINKLITNRFQHVRFIIVLRHPNYEIHSWSLHISQIQQAHKNTRLHMFEYSVYTHQKCKRKKWQQQNYNKNRSCVSVYAYIYNIKLLYCCYYYVCCRAACFIPHLPIRKWLKKRKTIKLSAKWSRRTDVYYHFRRLHNRATQFLGEDLYYFGFVCLYFWWFFFLMFTKVKIM